MGLLIVVEGIDGAGKTTQVRLLGAALAEAGEEPVLSKEPTSGKWGQKLRQSAQNGRMSLDEELETFLKDRREHAATTIRPALDRDQIVVLDRYFYSTIAYQGARGADRQDLMRRMAEFPQPDVVLLLDADPEVTLGRIANGRNEEPNHFEQAEQLHQVREVFNWLAETDGLVAKIDAHQSIEAVHRQIAGVLIDGSLKTLRAKPYDCDPCWPGLCSFGATHTCRWLRIQAALRASAERRPAAACG